MNDKFPARATIRTNVDTSSGSDKRETDRFLVSIMWSKPYNITYRNVSYASVLRLKERVEPPLDIWLWR